MNGSLFSDETKGNSAWKGVHGARVLCGIYQIRVRDCETPGYKGIRQPAS